MWISAQTGAQGDPPMRKSRFTEAQIVGIVREYDAGVAAKELSRKHGVHANTIRLWKSEYSDMEVSDAVRLKQLESENLQTQRIIAPPDAEDRRDGSVD
jgi:putative transposase